MSVSSKNIVTRVTCIAISRMHQQNESVVQGGMHQQNESVVQGGVDKAAK